MVLSHQVRNGGNIQNFESINKTSKEDVPSARVFPFVFSSYFTIIPPHPDYITGVIQDSEGPGRNGSYD